MPLLPFPPAPTPDDRPADFNAKAAAVVAAWGSNIEGLNALEANVVAKEAAVNAAAASAVAAAASAAVTGSKWVSGTFADGDVRWSPLNYQTFRKKGNGPGTTDPSQDSANWVALTSGLAIGSLLYTRDNFGGL